MKFDQDLGGHSIESRNSSKPSTTIILARVARLVYEQTHAGAMVRYETQSNYGRLCMSASFDIKMKVAFHDLDPMQVVWHGNYFKYFDVARFGLFAQRGIDLYEYMMTKQYVFPVTRTSIKHIAALRPNDEFICRAVVNEATYKIGMAFSIRLTTDGKLCARGNSEQVAVRFPLMEMEFEIPEDIRQALEL